MANTNIDLDEQFVRTPMERYGLRTKKDAVDFALRQLVDPVPTSDELRSLEGTGWDGDLDSLRNDL